MKSKIVKYEQRLKTNINNHMDKFRQNMTKQFNNYLSSYDYFGFSIYDELIKKTKLKIKRNDENRIRRSC
jgi:hypothetical protein